MVYGGTRLDNSDYGKYDDYKAQRENGCQCRFLLSIDLQVPKKSQRQCHDK